MAELRYRTIAQENPRGKQKVFFISHPDDFECYFEEITKLILNFQNNAAIWYSEECSGINLEDLDGMQLFVIPITAKFLYKPNEAREVVFAYLQEKHIPILPILMDDGLENEFNRICGNLQIINFRQKDATELPYEEKIRKFLEGVLVGDELAKKVRAAFDAYIFLSYRKMDRKYAQELMRLIHKNPTCRDIAIWYDEFLTPGGNFDAEIEAALDKSQVFALVITPNLVNSQYIVTKEYPKAIEKDKRIIPAEMTETDIAELESVLPGLPKVINGNDEKSLRESLLQNFENIAKTENDDEPEHNFFIGLAYLNGIDVEVDTGRGAKLITMAAEAGVPEACEKLYRMYQTGDGVNRDYNTAVEWEIRCIELLEAEYRKNKSGSQLFEIFSQTWTLTDDLNSLGQLDREQAYAEKMLMLAKEMHERSIKQARRYLSISYNSLGDISRARGKVTEAEAYYKRGLDIRETLVEETGSIEAQRDLSISYEKMGEISREQGKLEEAKNYYTKILKIRENLAGKIGTIVAWRDLSISYERLGDISREQGDLEEAKEYYEKGLKISKEQAEETRTIEALRDLSISYNNLGDISREQGKMEEAKTYYGESLKLREEQAEKTETIEALRGVSISYNKFGDICLEQGKTEEAVVYYEKSLRIREKLANETEKVEARRDLSISYSNLGDINRAQGKSEEAKVYYLKCLNITEELAEETETIEARRDLGISYENLGDVSRNLRELEEAEDYYEKSLKIREELAEETGTIEDQRNLSISYGRLGNIRQNQGKLEEAEEYYAKSLKIRVELVEKTESIETRRDLSISYERMGDICRLERKLEAAKSYYERSLEIRSRLVEEAVTIRTLRDLSIACNRLGDISLIQDKTEEAEAYYKKGLRISEVLVEETGTSEARQDLSISYENLGDVRRAQGNFEEAEGYYEKSRKIKAELGE